MSVIFSKNPLIPFKDRVEMELKGSVKADELLRIVRVPDAIIDVNGKVLQGDLSQYDISPRDFVRIFPIAYGGGNSRGTGKIILGVVLVIIGILTYAYGGAFLIGTGISLIIGGITSFLIKKPNLPGQGPSSGESENPIYTISSGQNNYRPGSMLPMAMGRIRFFPDFGSQPWVSSTNLNVATQVLLFNEFQRTISFPTFSDVIRHVLVAPVEGFVNPYFPQPPTFTYGATQNNSWVLLTALQTGYAYDVYVDKMFWDTYGALVNESISIQHDGDGDGFIIIFKGLGAGDGAAVWNGFVYHHVVGDPLYQKYQSVTNFIDTIGGAPGTGQSAAPILKFGTPYAQFETVNPKFTMKLSQIFNFGYGDLIISDERIENTELTQYREVVTYSSVPAYLDWKLAPEAPHSNVDTTEGSKLVNNADFAYPNNWIVRESPDDTFYIQIDIGGRLFRQNPSSGIVSNAASFNFQYRNVASDTWIDIDSATVTISRGITDQFRFTYDAFVPRGKYEVRCRKTTPDETDSNFICDVDFLEVRWFRKDDADYVGQNRKAINIRATEQLNGRIGKYNCAVSAKCWVWRDGAWYWEETSNPAWWFLYFARGGWKNPTGVQTASPTIGWQNGIAGGNTTLIWGCGLEDERIDIDGIKAWATFCEEQDLQFNGVFNDDRNAQDALAAITAVGRASQSWTKGKLGVVVESGTDQPVAMFGMSNIRRGSFSVNYIADQIPDRVRGTFFDETANYEEAEVFADRPDLVGNPKKEITVPLFGVTRAEQAQREINILAARQYYQRRQIIWDADVDGLIVQRGDVVSLSHDCLQWGKSGRILRFEHDGLKVTKFYVPVEFESPQTWVQIRKPDNTFLILECSTEGNCVTLLEDWPLSDAPWFLGEGTEYNFMSQFADTHPDDFLWLTDVKETPGKLLRLIAIVPKDSTSVTITAVDFEPAMWAYEFGDPGTVQRNSTVHAKVFGAHVKALTDVPGKNFRLYWEMDGCWGVKIEVSENGGPLVPYILNGMYSVFGSSCDFNYPESGTRVEMVITPIVAGTPYSSKSERIVYTVP